VGTFIAAGRFGQGIEGARILTRRIGFGKGFGEVFLTLFASTDDTVLRCASRRGG